MAFTNKYQNVLTFSVVNLTMKFEGSPQLGGSNEGGMVFNFLCGAIPWKWCKPKAQLITNNKSYMGF